MCPACIFRNRSWSGSRGQGPEGPRGKQLCIDLIQEIREIEGVAGIHVMAYRQEEFVNEIIHASGVMKNRKPRPIGAGD